MREDSDFQAALERVRKNTTCRTSAVRPLSLSMASRFVQEWPGCCGEVIIQLIHLCDGWDRYRDHKLDETLGYLRSSFTWAERTLSPQIEIFDRVSEYHAIMNGIPLMSAHAVLLNQRVLSAAEEHLSDGFCDDDANRQVLIEMQTAWREANRDHSDAGYIARIIVMEQRSELAHHALRNK